MSDVSTAMGASTGLADRTLGSLAGVTVVTACFDQSLLAYERWLGYRGEVVHVAPDLAARWGCPAAEGARLATLFPESGERRFLRLIEGQPGPGYRPLTSFGWFAAEIVVQDVDRLAEHLKGSPFSIIGPPALLDFTDQIKAMQVMAPGGEVLYLTEIKSPLPGFRLPQAQSFVGQLFIMVLAARDIPEAAATYTACGSPLGPELMARIGFLSAAHGLPEDYQHRLATIALSEASLLEIDASPPGTTSRPLSSLGLPSGIAMVSFNATGGPACLVGAAGEWIEVL